MVFWGSINLARKQPNIIFARTVEFILFTRRQESQATIEPTLVVLKESMLSRLMRMSLMADICFERPGNHVTSPNLATLGRLL